MVDKNGRPSVSGSSTARPRRPGPDDAADPDPNSDPEAASRRWLSPGILGIGGASFLSDAGHEMVTSVLPTFLTSTLHSGPGALGAIDGVSDALTGLSKLAGGPLANDPRRRGRLASGGYLGTGIATAAIGLTTAVWQVGILRAFAWVSRGLRSPARDMLLTSLAPQHAYGRAFGLERAGDNAGAIIGPLAASGLVAWLGVRHAILLAVVPGILAAVSVTIAAREARRTIGEAGRRRTLTLNLGALSQAGLARVLTPIAFFELGNVATTLLILRATQLLHTGSGHGAGRDLTAATSLAILLYAAHNGAGSVAALLGGHLADRLHPRSVFTAGAVVYVAAYTIFAVGSRDWPVIGVGFVLAGIGIGLAETAESTVLALGLPDDLRANGFGVLGLTQALGDLGATVVAGALWTFVSPTVAFAYVATWMAASVISSRLLRPRQAAGEDGGSA
jgi:MFS family permease